MTVNSELSNVNDLLTSNKLTLNTKKSNCVIFRPYQKQIKTDFPKIGMFDQDLKENVTIKSRRVTRFWKHVHVKKRSLVKKNLKRKLSASRLIPLKTKM